MDEKTIRCGHCKQVLPSSMFYKRTAGKLGFHTVCKTCMKKLYNINHQRKAADGRAFASASVDDRVYHSAIDGDRIRDISFMYQLKKGVGNEVIMRHRQCLAYSIELTRAILAGIPEHQVGQYLQANIPDARLSLFGVVDGEPPLQDWEDGYVDNHAEI